jgi:hypothetical protein
MLHKFLKLIQDGEVQSVLEISRTLQVPPAMVLQMVENLTRKGYLQEMGTMCDTPQSPCSDCAAKNGCQELTRGWFLTEKGRAAVLGYTSDSHD